MGGNKRWYTYIYLCIYIITALIKYLLLNQINQSNLNTYQFFLTLRLLIVLFNYCSILKLSSIKIKPNNNIDTGQQLKYNKRESIDVETIGYQVKKLYTKKFNELINDLKSIRSLAFLGKLSEIEINLQYLYKIFNEEKIE